MTYRNPKLLKAARDQACIRCGAEDGTVVPQIVEVIGRAIMTADQHP